MPHKNQFTLQSYAISSWYQVYTRAFFSREMVWWKVMCVRQATSSALDFTVTIMCRNHELSSLLTNRSRATRYMKVKSIEITEILRRIWLFSAKKIQSPESGRIKTYSTHRWTQLIIVVNNCHTLHRGFHCGCATVMLCLKWGSWNGREHLFVSAEHKHFWRGRIQCDGLK